MIQVGSIVIAKVDSFVCTVGERGVCYAVSTIADRPSYGIIFSGGKYDGFSPDDAKIFLSETGKISPQVAGYIYRDAATLKADFRQGVFEEALKKPPQPKPPLPFNLN